MKFLVALTILAAVSASFLGREDEEMFKFMKFIQQHNREYASLDEFHAKFEIFKNNLRKVDTHETFSPFMDLTEEEFSFGLNLNVSAIAEARSKMETYKVKNVMGELPENFDWRQHGAVSEVKNQGQCGSCWAFSAVGNLEGLNAIKSGKMTTFSEQQLVDCDTVDQGCNGGLMDNAFQYIQQAGGIETEADYSYTGRGGKCQFDESKSALKVVGFQDISSNEDEIARVLHENGPLSVAVNATPFQFYTGGILKGNKRTCNPRMLNHGVTLVGYGEEDGTKFWIIKNSWGTGWGEEGYIRLERGCGACGVNTNVSTAKLE